MDDLVGEVQNACRRCDAGYRLSRSKGLGRIAALQPKPSADGGAGVRLPRACERRAERDVVAGEKRRAERSDADLEVVEVKIVDEERLAVIGDVGRELVCPFLVGAAGVEQPLSRPQAVDGHARCGGEAIEVGFVDEEQLGRFGYGKA